MIAHVQRGGGAVPALAYDAQTRGPVPIPPSERGLQAVVAEPWFKVSDEGLVLEGPAFDRDERVFARLRRGGSWSVALIPTSWRVVRDADDTRIRYESVFDTVAY